uniref:Uncharacterized protein n=1 Tax=Vespula pensylvanica TaxID=30213 RepID=A0A834NXZ9_VESPE|nr:hypothetical protein H0235_011000 [Vespula pensylvanica]
MAIMQSCCCWQSVRRGSYACAIYTGIYFIILAITTGTILQAESEYLSGNRSLPESSSFLESDTISPTTVRFNITLLICSCFGVICCILLVYGLFKDKRIFLLPWIVNVITCSMIDIAHALYLIIVTVYSVLCVISQYQEYLAGRGTAADDTDYRVRRNSVSWFTLKCENVSPIGDFFISERKSQYERENITRSSVPVVRYVVQPTTTATSCLSSRRAPTNNETKETPTPTQSPTAARNVLSCPEKSPTVGRTHKKHVQFPDTPTPTSSSTPTAIPMSLEKSEIPLTDSNTKYTMDIGISFETH